MSENGTCNITEQLPLSDLKNTGIVESTEAAGTGNILRDGFRYSFSSHNNKAIRDNVGDKKSLSIGSPCRQRLGRLPKLWDW